MESNNVSANNIHGKEKIIYVIFFVCGEIIIRYFAIIYKQVCNNIRGFYKFVNFTNKRSSKNGTVRLLRRGYLIKNIYGCIRKKLSSLFT